MSQEEYDDIEMDVRAKMIDEVLKENSLNGDFPLGAYAFVFISAPIYITALSKLITRDPIVMAIILFGSLVLFIAYIALMVNIYKRISNWRQ